MDNWEIKQDLEHRYLVCKVRQKQEDYRVRMLVHLEKTPLLACRTRRVNGELLLAYDVGDRCSLTQLCETEAVNVMLLRSLLAAIKDAYEKLQSYLLEPDMLLLSPETIFYKADDCTFSFCCTPAAETDSFVRLHALSQFLLKVLDREDEEAVRLGYALYRSSLPEQLQQTELMQLLQAAAREKNGQTETVQTSTQPEAEQKETVQIPEAPTVAQKQEEKPRKKHAARAFFQGLFQERRKEQPYFSAPYANALPSYAGEKLFAYGGGNCILQGQKKELPTFSPTEYPFLIGSLEFGVDGYIDDVTVSRFHARLEKTDGRYYLTDLDSAHGTKRNGEPLPPQEKTGLQNGDEISFGHTRFRFVVQ